MRALLVLGPLLAASCWSVDPADGAYGCAATGQCPEGMTCQCGECWRAQRPDCECGCTIGSRTRPLELRLDKHDRQRLCFCSAAWDAPGVVGKAPACGRSPAPTDGAGCTVADSCAAGWSVCGLEAALASAFGDLCHDAPAGIWVTSSAIGHAPPLCNASGPSGTCLTACSGGRSTALDRSACQAPWSCGDDLAGTLRRGAAAGEGGVMCCRDR